VRFACVVTGSGRICHRKLRHLGVVPFFDRFDTNPSSEATHGATDSHVGQTGLRTGLRILHDVHHVHAWAHVSELVPGSQLPPWRFRRRRRALFCADLAGLDRIRGDAVHFVVTGHFVDSHAIGAIEPQHVSVAFPAAICQPERC